MDADGRHRRALAPEFQADDRPAWSPDGRQIAFRVVVNGSPKIAVVGLDGSPAYIVNLTGAADSSAVWSPDGNWILYVSFRDGNPRLYAVNPNCQDSERGCRYNDHLVVTSMSTGWPVSWSPDGRVLVFVRLLRGQSALYAADIACTDQPANCVRGLRALTNRNASNRYPAWSPDGRRIAFISNRDGRSDLYVMEASTGDLRRLTNVGIGGHLPAWSPDGRRIAFESDLVRGGRSDLYLVNIVTGELRPLRLRGLSNVNPAWRS